MANNCQFDVNTLIYVLVWTKIDVELNITLHLVNYHTTVINITLFLRQAGSIKVKQKHTDCVNSQTKIENINIKQNQIHFSSPSSVRSCPLLE